MTTRFRKNKRPKNKQTRRRQPRNLKIQNRKGTPYPRRFLAPADNNKIGKNMVMNTDKLVYGKFWMNSCSHCITIAPIWDDVVKYIKMKHGDKTINIDSESNEADKNKNSILSLTSKTVSVDGFPTIYAVSRNMDTVYYNGQRTVENIKNWIEQLLLKQTTYIKGNL
jgi:hypothetical protein